MYALLYVGCFYCGRYLKCTHVDIIPFSCPAAPLSHARMYVCMYTNPALTGVEGLERRLDQRHPGACASGGGGQARAQRSPRPRGRNTAEHRLLHASRTHTCCLLQEPTTRHEANVHGTEQTIGAVETTVGSQRLFRGGDGAALCSLSSSLGWQVWLHGKM